MTPTAAEASRVVVPRAPDGQPSSLPSADERARPAFLAAYRVVEDFHVAEFGRPLRRLLAWDEVAALAWRVAEAVHGEVQADEEASAAERCRAELDHLENERDATLASLEVADLGIENLDGTVDHLRSQLNAIVAENYELAETVAALRAQVTDLEDRRAYGGGAR
jgi:cell division protein FtsB